MSDFNWLKESLDKIEEKVNSLDEKVDVSLLKHEKNSAVLEEHQRRSIANEENLELLRQEFKPVQQHVIMLNGALKFIGLIATFVSVAAGIVKILEYFR